jgi:hypothetical protein
MATAPVLVPTLVPGGGGSGGIGGGLTTIYRARLANGLQTHVIPFPGRLCGHTAAGAPNNHFFRPVSPHGHIYMEIDPVYARLGPPPGYGTRGSDDSTASSEGSCGDAHQPDVSDDDTMLHQLQQLQQLRLTCVDPATAAASSRESSAAASYSARLAEERPLIRNNTLRRSAPLGSGGGASAPGALHGQWDHAGGGGRAGGSVRIVRSPLRRHCDITGARHHFETPITIALGGGGGGRTNGGEPWFGGINTDNNQWRSASSSRRPGASIQHQHLHFASVQPGYAP